MGGQTVPNSNKILAFTICSQDGNTKITTQAIILPQLMQFLPSFKVTYRDLREYDTTPLADPNCFASPKTDMVIGSNILPKILVPRRKNNAGGSLIRQNTIFGWILSGPLVESISAFTTQEILTTADPKNYLRRRFWKQKEIKEDQAPKEEETFCENI